MTRGRARRYLLTKQGYYPGVVASMGYDVWDWSTLNAGTLFQDSAKTTPAVANGDVIGCWIDGVGGVDATQATTANKPGLATGTLNGLYTLSFDGSDILATGNISISTFAVWVVVKATSSTQIFYEQGTNSVTADGMFLASTGATELTANIYRTPLRDSRRVTGVTYTDFSIYRTEHQGTNASNIVYQNNVLQSMVDSINNDVGTGTATQPLFIGARSGGVIPLTGNIAHLCIVSPYPTAQIIASMESYINGIWGVY